MKKRSLKFILLFIVISTFFLAQEWRICTRVVDGDTIILDGYERVRLIGVDTPEISHPRKPVQFFAKKASEFTRKLVPNKKVRLEFDQEKKDKYGRTLAYVFLEDGTFLNAEIIKQGYGFAYTKYPFKYMDEFKAYEREAREKGLGLWGNEGMDEYYWLLAQEREPFLVYEMENNWWGLKYKNFVKVRLTDEELLKEIKNLRIWVHEYNEKDLERILLKKGYKKEGGKNEEKLN